MSRVDSDSSENQSIDEPLLLPIGDGLLKKAIEVKSWVVMDTTGKVQQLEAGKHEIMRRTGLQGRDLRVLDPSLSYASTIIGHDRAIVIKLEHVKAIIMAEEVLLLDSLEPVVIPFVDQIRTRVMHHYKSKEARDGANLDDSNNFVRIDKQEVMENRDGAKLLPFEFIALEACLEAACGCLETEARTLELETVPALDRLTSEIKAEVENLLDDDQDIAEMYLTRKSQEHIDNSSHPSSMMYDADAIEDRDSDFAQVDLHRKSEQGFIASIHSNVLKKYLNVAELEALLEPYFVQIGGTLDRLLTLRETVDSTENHINLMLDDMQNQMLRLKIVLITAGIMLTAFLTVAATMAINIGIGVFEDDAHGDRNLLLICFVSTVVLVSAFGIVMWWFRYKRLL